MPFEYVENDENDNGSDTRSVDIKCVDTFCLHNDNGACTCDEHVEDLDWSDSNFCDDKEWVLIPDKEYRFPNQEDLESFAAQFDEVVLVPYDINCTCLLFIEISGHKALIQMRKEDRDKVLFRPHVDGSILVVDKNQLSLTL